MSRSYKKTPYVGLKKHKVDKRNASKAARHAKNLVNGKVYKKIPGWSYRICDQYCIYTWRRFKFYYSEWFESEEECYIYWYKHYKRK